MVDRSPIDVHVSGLPDSMSPIYSLQISLRVEIAVIDDNCISRIQIDSQSSCSRAQHENELIAILASKVLYLPVPVLKRGLPTLKKKNQVQ